mgnify:CR=1 FL=1
MEDQSFQARMCVKNPELMQLYSYPTPNGVKVAAALEEIVELKTLTAKASLPETSPNAAAGSEEERIVLYEPHAVNIRSAENRLKWFCHIGFKNHKIPGLIDPACTCTPEERERCIQAHSCASGGIPTPGSMDPLPGSCFKCRVAIFESGAILTYLSEKYDELMPRDKLMRIATTNWLFYGSTMVSTHFKLFGFYYKYCSHGIPYCVERYTREVHQELKQMDYQLRHGKHWIVGDAYTVADISMWPWVHALFVNYDNAGEVVFDMQTLYPSVFAWYTRCLARPASKRALEVCHINFD